MQIQTFACIMAGLLALTCTFQGVLSDTDPEKLKSMAETLKILQNLDKYYAQIARPRGYLSALPRTAGNSDLKLSSDMPNFLHKQTLRPLHSKPFVSSPRSGSWPALKYLSDVQEAVHKVRLRELDRKYLQRTRPRFGKRGEYPRYQEEILNGEEVQYPPEQRFWDRLVR